MDNPFFDHPVLNSPYERPTRHWELDESGQPTQRILETRRRAQFITPIPKPKKQKTGASQQKLLFDEGKGISSKDQQYDPNPIINEVRQYVDQWRALPASQWQVTPETARLLQHWRHHPFENQRPFFCQVEAVETVIWLTEVASQSAAGRRLLDNLASVNRDANPDLSRLALKLATGAGKTTVMAMLIAWQTINAVRRPGSTRFSRGFLVVAPGITIKDRLRVLLPNDPESYYRSRDLVPADLQEDLGRAKIVITNYHAFKRRERLEVSKGGRALLKGRGQDLQTLETEGQMIQRVLPDLMGLKNIVVLNDEAHHCYREKPGGQDDDPLKGDEKKEAQKNNEAARLWISGLEAIQRKLGIARVIDLSATPFFLRGSGYVEGTLFPWTMCDFSLMDAIECGIVKLPRVPVADNIPGAEVPLFRNLWENIRTDMPKKGKGKSGALDPLALPALLKTALEALYGHYEKTFQVWEQERIGVPPCFIVICNNTATSKLVYDYVAGFDQVNDDGSETPIAGSLPLFRNADEHGNPLPRPRTLLIDSEQLESGEALDENFRAMAADEIERFQRDILERGGKLADLLRQGKGLDDATLLREVMNTVGKVDQLGGEIRCVVSVSMLTEGWDCLDSQTQILTPDGWRGMNDVGVGNLVYSLNRETERLEATPVLEYGSRPTRAGEKMVRLQSQHLDIRVTEGHEFHVKFRDPRRQGALSRTWQVRTGRELAARRSAYGLPLAAERAEPFPGVPLTDDELRLVAWFLTDGGFSGYRLVISQAKEHRHDIRDLLNRLGLDYKEYEGIPGAGTYPNARRYSIFSVPKGTHRGTLARKGWSVYQRYLDKSVSSLLHNMTREQFAVFWEELLKGDGEKSSGKSGWLWCDRIEQADAYTRMAILRGYSASYHEERTAKGKTVYRVSVRDARWLTSDPGDTRATPIVLEDPMVGERVWCVRNANSTLVTRRNGKIVILGNCNTVTHVLGVRAFGTQLLCEQVIGRALRRQSYELDEEGLFPVEYADVLGIPFDFNAKPVVAPPQKPRPTIHVKAVRPERDRLEIVFPRVEGYRIELPEERLTATFNEDSILTLTPELVGPSRTQNAGIIGQAVDLTLEHLDDLRPSTVLYHLTHRLLMTKWRDPGEEPKLHLFGQLKRIAKEWLDTCLVCKGGTYPGLLMYQELADMACERITAGITAALMGERPIRAMLDPYNPTGSTMHVNFTTSKPDRWQTAPDRSHVNWAILDSGWEGEFCRVVEGHPRVRAYVKNQGLGFEVPYRYQSEMRRYLPDFIVRVDDGRGDDDLLNLVVEVKGYKKQDAYEKKLTMNSYWVPGVNHLGSYGRWAFAEFTEVYEFQSAFDEMVKGFCV